MTTRTAPAPRIVQLTENQLIKSAVAPPLPWWSFLGAAMLLTAVLYLPSLQNGLTNWDDTEYLTANPLLDFSKTPFAAYFTTVVSGNLHPLTMLSLSLDAALGGSLVRQVHTTSLLLHVLNVGLTFGLAWQLSGGRRLVSFLVAVWFGIHPMHVESVAWVAERKDVLYGFFFLLSLISYWQFLATRRGLFVVLSLLTGVLANGAKPAAVILPVVLVLLTFWHDKKLTMNQLMPVLPFVAMSAFFAWQTLQAQTAAAAINNDFSLPERLQLGGYALVNYVLKAVWPVGLSALYGRPGPGGAFPAIFLVYTVISGLGLAGLALLYRRANGWFFGLSFFVINLLLTLQVVKVMGSAAYADRYTYLAYTGLFFAAALTLDSLRQCTWKRLALGLAGLFTVGLAWQTVAHTAVWKNSETLWTDVLKTQPFSATAYSNRALYYEQNDRLPEALADYSVAVQADPRPLYRANRAYLLTRLDRPAEAEADADFLLAQDPANTLALTIKGTALVKKNQPTAALTYLKQAYALDSTYLNAVANLGSAYFTDKQYAEAAHFYRKALRLSPNNPLFLTNLGAAYLQNKQYAEAAATCQQAILAQPQNGQAHLFACYALHKTGHRDQARQMATRARQLGQTLDPRVALAL